MSGADSGSPSRDAGSAGEAGERKDVEVAEALVEAALDVGIQEDVVVPEAEADAEPDAGPQLDSGLETAADAPVEAGCLLNAVGTPVRVLAFDGKAATSPSLAVFAPGDSSSGQAAGVAVQAFGLGSVDSQDDDFRLVGVQVGLAWPASVGQEWREMSVGAGSLGGAQMTLSSDAQQLAFFWRGAEAGSGILRFRKVDIATWTPGPITDAWSPGTEVVGIAAGAGTGPMGVGWGATGYGVVWHSEKSTALGTATQSNVAVLNESGDLVLGPHMVSPPIIEYPTPTSSITWTGTTYLMATAFRTCSEATPLCEERSVVVSRMLPASGDTSDDSAVEKVVSFGAVTWPEAPVIAQLASASGMTWLAWFEGHAEDANSPRVVRVALLDPTGAVLSGPEVVYSGAMPADGHLMSMSAGELGAVVTWPERGDPTIPANQLGATKIKVIRLGGAGQLIEDLTIPSTAFGSYGSTWSGTLRNPKGVVVTWNGAAYLPGKSDVVFLARLDCAE